MNSPEPVNNATLDTVRAAAKRIRSYAHRTPVLSSTAINERVGCKIQFKCENLQKIGAFKFRGACNTVFSLSDEQASQGVITHSSGNHAAALALAARIRGVEAVIVMPDNAPGVKRRAVAGYGAQIVDCPATQADRERTVEELQSVRPRTLVHPYDDPRVISGQGTAALEMLADCDGLDALIVPVGGGGLLAGTTLAARSAPGVTVFGAEPLAADDAKRSFDAGFIIPVEHPDTIADGLRTSLGTHNYAIIKSGVADILTVSEDAIIEAMRLIWERMKLVVEPSGAVPLAALMERGVPDGCKNIGIIISGGNVDLDHLPWVDR